MRIVHVIPALTKGGAEKVLVDLANEASRRGHEVAVVAGYPANIALNRARLDPAIGFETIVSGETAKLGAYLQLPLWLLRNRERIDAFDVVHCHLTYAALLGTGTSLLRRLRGKVRPAVVETFHGVGMPIRRRQRLLATLLARGRDGFALMAEDSFWGDFLAARPNLASAVIPNGMSFDPPAVPAAARDWRSGCGIPIGVPVAGSVWRIRAERNPLALLATFAEIARTDSSVHFLIVGDGPMTDAVRKRAVELGISERLHLPGLVADPQLAFANIDVYISMNVGPITGLAGLEAAAAALPVIAIQARADYERQTDDWIWASTDPVEVGREAARLLAEPGARRKLAHCQHAHVTANFGISATQDAYEELYARAMASRQL